MNMNSNPIKKSFHIVVVAGLFLLLSIPITVSAGVHELVNNALSSVIMSDDFDQCILDPGLWTIYDPLTDGSVALSAGKATLSVPAGTNHEPWKTNNSLRIMQAADNVDFEVEAKFDSPLIDTYQEQGLLVEADTANYLRFDFHSEGLNTKIIAVSIEGGTTATIRHNTIITGTNEAPLYMRVARSGDQWTQSYSFDGTAWTATDTFTHTLTVSSAGVFVGNYGSGGSAPAHTAIVDYFYNTASPGTGDVLDKTLSVQITGNGQVDKSPDQATYACNDVVTLTAIPDTGNLFTGWSIDVISTDNPLEVTIDADKTIGASFVLAPYNIYLPFAMRD